MSRVAIFAAVIAAAVALAGCGGGGVKAPSQPSSMNRAQVLDLLTLGLKNSANIREQDTNGVRASRAAVPAPSEKRSRLAPTTREPVEGDGPYFNDFLGLWVLEVLGNNDQPDGPTGQRFFVDEAMTQTGGHALTWITSDGGESFSIRSEETYTVGSFAGEWHKDLFSNGHSEGSGFTPNVGGYTYTGDWSDLSGDWTERFEAVDGSWHNYSWKTTDEGENFHMTTSVGITMDLNYLPVGSGTGSITGPSTALPAKLVWDEVGNGTITWADGTASEFTGWNFFNEGA